MDFTIEQIKRVFWKTFHKEGEIWFDYLGTDKECEASTNDYWGDFKENLINNTDEVNDERKDD